MRKPNGRIRGTQCHWANIYDREIGMLTLPVEANHGRGAPCAIERICLTSCRLFLLWSELGLPLSVRSIATVTNATVRISQLLENNEQNRVVDMMLSLA